MPGRNRTAKSLGQRHDLHYFQRWTRWRIVRAVLMIAFPVSAGIWLLGYSISRNESPYVSGPLSSAHSFAGKRCSVCHEPAVKAGGVRVGFRKHVRDDSCLGCHRAPAHQALQTFAPSCASCHIEHVGSNLRQTTDEACVQCHAELKVKNGTPHYETAIYAFNGRHPEFAPLRDNFRDAGTIKLNHKVHMRAGLLGPHSQQVQMQCQDCHRTPAEQNQPWKYGEPRVVDTPLHLSDPHRLVMPADPLRPGDGGAYMVFPSYATACQSCHALQFDSHFSDSVPHDKPEVVHEFIVRKLTEYIRQHPEAVNESPRPMRIVFSGSISREPLKPRVARTAAEWIRFRTEDAEILLWHKTCVQCHTLTYLEEGGRDALPEVAPANAKSVWLPHSIFSHYSHASIDCRSCHTRSITSEETSDVLIPSIKTCQACHNGEPTKVGQAQSGCFLCHQYHDWKQRSTTPVPTHTIQELRGANTSLEPGLFSYLGNL